jgi:hypothetical protein
LKKRYFALIIAIIILGSLVVGYLIGTGKFAVPYLPSGSSSTVNSLSTVCTTNGETNGVILQIVQNNYSSRPPGIIPVSGATVNGTDVYYCGNLKHQGTFVSSTTNSSGIASLLFGGGGMYYLNIYYQGPENYSITVPVSPLATTYVTYNISTGNLSTSVCYFGEHC